MADIKRKCLSLKMKVEIIKLVDEGSIRKCDIARKFGIPANSLSTILKNRDILLKRFYEGSIASDRKKIRNAKHKDIENALFDWLKSAQAKNIPINNPILKEKAVMFARLFNKSDFNPGIAWLQRFKERHNIVFKKNYRESVNVDNPVISTWLESKENLINHFLPSDIYTVKETGIFYQLLPEKTFVLKNESCTNGKHSEERLTVLICCNMDGSDKRQILVIGKSDNSQCFSGIKKLSSMYQTNKNSWMSSKLFGKWLTEFDDDISKQERNILLFLDNSASHITSIKLNSITLCYFPPNITSTFKPMDMGIIKGLKGLYRIRILRHILVNLENDKSCSIDIKTACDFISDAWRNIDAITIQNCWKSAGFLITENEVIIPDHIEIPPLSFNEENLWENLRQRGVIPTVLSFDDYVAVDFNVVTEKEAIDENSIASVKDDSGDSVAKYDNEEENNKFKFQKQINSKIAAESLQNLRTYFEVHGIDCNECLNTIEAKLCESIVTLPFKEKSQVAFPMRNK